MGSTASYKQDSLSTTVYAKLEANETVFVVFHDKALQNSKSLPQKQYSELKELTGGWDISFAQGLGAPEKIHIDQLASWTENRNDSVNYFSGTATYSKPLDVKKNG